MNTTSTRFRLLAAPAIAIAAAAMLGAGCVAIPMGTQTFETEYPTEIRPTLDATKKTYAPEPVVAEGDQFHRTATIALAAKITIEQQQVQKIEKVSVEKKKRMSFGLFPSAAENATSLFTNDGSLQGLIGWGYYGKGEYSSKAPGDLGVLGFYLGFIPMTVYATLLTPFADSYECSSHHWADRGKTISEANYLAKFSKEDRDRIGAWIWSDNDRHRQRPFVSSFTHAKLFGFHKYCRYTIRGPFEEDRPADPKITMAERTVIGPYSATLTLPGVGFSQTIDVPAGGTAATFNLANTANGQSVANGTIRFSPPSGGLGEVKNADDKACLKEAMEHDYPVSIALPAPKLGDVVD